MVADQAWSEVRVEQRAPLEIMALLAGQIAEKRAGRRANHVGARFDYKRAVDLALHLSGSTRQVEALLRWLTIRTEDLLELRWYCVAAVATALLARKTLSGKQLREAILEAMDSVRACAIERGRPPGRRRPT